MITKRILRAALFVLIAGALISMPTIQAAADDIPSGTPHCFYGSLLINGSPAPAFTTVEAKATGVKNTTHNPLTTTTAGEYGTPGFYGDKLIVQGGETLVNGTELSFYVNDVFTEQTHKWQSGNVTKLDLSVDIPIVTVTGGGGGGGSPPEITTNFFGDKDTFRITNTGRILETIVVTSPDGKLTITIPYNTIARDSLGNRLSNITVDVDPDPPCPLPEDEGIIGLAYSFKPDGATFIPPIEIEFTYEPGELPEGVTEGELIIAFCDEATGEWIQVPGVVDEENNTITAQISHFSTYAIIGKGIIIIEEPEPTPQPTPEPTPAPEPAVFSTKSMSVLPSEVNPGDMVQINVIISNTGGKSGTHDVILKVNGVKEDSEVISLNAGESKEVMFTISRGESGTYQIECDGLKGSFVVKEAVEPVTPEPEVTPAPVVTEEGIQWWIWVIIAAAVVAAVIAGLYLYRRRVQA